MTNKEFRHLSRADLIEIIYQLQQSEKAAREENEALRQKLKDRQMVIEKSGSLAEVLAKLNDLFEATQITANGYIEEAQRIRRQADDYLAGAKRQADQMTGHLLEERKRVLAQTAEECRQLRAAAQKEASVPQQSSEDPEPDASPHSVREPIR